LIPLSFVHLAFQPSYNHPPLSNAQFILAA